jgi:hypothetical protein
MRRLGIALLLFSCTSDMQDATSEQQPPPTRPLTLVGPSSAAPGDSITVSVTLPVNAPAAAQNGFNVFFPSTTDGFGTGFCGGPLNGSCLDIVGAVDILGGAPTVNGTATLSYEIPSPFTASALYVQSVIVAPSGRAFLSNPIEIEMVAGPGPGLQPYVFERPAGSGQSSVSNASQYLRHVLIADLDTFIGSLTDLALIGSGSLQAPDVLEGLDSFFDFDSAFSGSLPHAIATMPPALQTTYDEIATSGNLLGKVAGNDVVTDHRDWSAGNFAGWPGADSPEELLRSWMFDLAVQTDDFNNGFIGFDPSGLLLQRVDLTPDGWDLSQLIEKFLRVSVSYSQATDDYLDDDVLGKGVLADHITVGVGSNSTRLEENWDRAFGYFGASRTYGGWNLDQRVSAYLDDNGDSAIDLRQEKAWHAARIGAKRDIQSVTGTRLGDRAYRAFYEGRALLARTSGPLSATDRTALLTYRDQAVAAWEEILVATVIHKINDLIAETQSTGTVEYDFSEIAKHWSQVKGYALGFQFNPRKRMTDAEFLALHDAIGMRPATADDDPVTRAVYIQGLQDVRDLLGSIYDFEPADVEGW